MAETVISERTTVVHRGRKLEYFIIGWNSLEGLVAVAAGGVAGSISLVGFGIDSFIEVTSGSVLLWRMSVDADVPRRERNERRALKVVGLGPPIPFCQSELLLRSANPAAESKADYTLRICAAAVDIGGKHIVSSTTYNGQFPGPLLRFQGTATGDRRCA